MRGGAPRVALPARSVPGPPRATEPPRRRPGASRAARLHAGRGSDGPRRRPPGGAERLVQRAGARQGDHGERSRPRELVAARARLASFLWGRSLPTASTRWAAGTGAMPARAAATAAASGIRAAGAGTWARPTPAVPRRRIEEPRSPDTQADRVRPAADDPLEQRRTRHRPPASSAVRRARRHCERAPGPPRGPAGWGLSTEGERGDRARAQSGARASHRGARQPPACAAQHRRCIVGGRAPAL